MNIEAKDRINSLSICFPAYNDGGTIASMVLTARIAARQITDDYEIIVTNDGSSDYTRQVLDEMCLRYPELRVIHHGSRSLQGNIHRRPGLQAGR